MTVNSLTNHNVMNSNLRLIGDELWLCHTDGITVYDCQWKRLRKIRLDRLARSVAALDTKTVVMATNSGLMLSSTSGMNVQIVINAA